MSEEINKEEILRAEKEEEAKLKAKYPTVRPGPQLLQKRMQKGHKYFDSGDYNMAKAAMKSNQKRGPSTLSQQSSSELPPPVDLPLVSPDSLTGNAIPNPDHLSTRKASIHVQSKLIS